MSWATAKEHVQSVNTNLTLTSKLAYTGKVTTQYPVHGTFQSALQAIPGRPVRSITYGSLDSLSGMDKTGQPTIRTTGCSSDVRRVNVRLHGDQAWLYNMFDGQVETFVKTQLRAKVSGVIR